MSNLQSFKHKIFLLGIFVMSCIDAVMTLLWVKIEMAEEVNPILDRFLEIGPLHFFLAKILLTVIGCLILYFFRKRTSSQAAAACLFVFYGALLLYHCLGSIIIIAN